MPAPLIEFPADDPERARRFWHGVLGGIDPEDAERVCRRGSAVGSQRALDRVDGAAAPVRVAAGRMAQTNGLP
jgi:hypothetical protein